MTYARKRKGELGERIAEAYLRFRGFRVIERNWRCSHGEIDLIVKRGCEYRFIEVKYRTSMDFGYPEEAITETKLDHIRKAAEAYLFSLKRLPKNYQIDIISILKIGENKPKIHWIHAV